jgi:hypothetical protein
LAAISSFVDSHRGAQRAFAKLVERFARAYHCEILFLPNPPRIGMLFADF